MAKAAPDGYTLLVSTNGVFAINKALYKAMPFDPDKDLAPLSLLATAPQMLVVHPSLGLKTSRTSSSMQSATPAGSPTARSAAAALRI